MTCDVVALCAGGVALLPFAGEAEVVCALAADVVVAEMVVEGVGVSEDLVAVLPEAEVPVLGGEGAVVGVELDVVVVAGVEDSDGGHVWVEGVEEGVFESGERDELSCRHFAFQSPSAKPLPSPMPSRAKATAPYMATAPLLTSAAKGTPSLRRAAQSAALPIAARRLAFVYT